MAQTEAIAGFNTVPPNSVLAGPSSGSAAGPTFRTLTTGDIPGPTPAALTDGATITWPTGGAASSAATVTLAGNRTLAITGAVAGARGQLLVTQDGTGSRTLALPAGSLVAPAGSGAIALTLTAGATDGIYWYYDGTNYWWYAFKNFT